MRSAGEQQPVECDFTSRCHACSAAKSSGIAALQLGSQHQPATGALLRSSAADETKPQQKSSRRVRCSDTAHRSCGKSTSPSANAATEEHPLHRDTSLVTRGSANPRIFFAYVILGQWCRCYWLLPQRAPCSYIHDRPGGPRPVAARRGAGGRCRTGPTRVVSARARRRLPSQARP